IPLRYGQRPADEQTMQSGQAKAPAFAPPCEAISLESVPLLAHCSARFDCITDVIHSAGDHCVVIARVLYFEASDHEPLIFAQGGFFGLSKR
ncbi:MAG: flavin reductase, partial [Betaproteobacteria bacterium]|nr:flavin reductase [Betaproteobacteria bacterium]